MTFDPGQVSYKTLLNVFWTDHDPTQFNRQGPDFGTQYRSAIFYHSPEQKQVAEIAKETLGQSGRFRKPIATEIAPATTFYRAVDYHQQYLAQRGLAHCHISCAFPRLCGTQSERAAHAVIFLTQRNKRYRSGSFNVFIL